ncbi:sigma-54 interaction domain-containing protein [Frigoriglobus tundricola]|uniref:Sigma-54 dependent DNA-binding response regulator n=1 Tax=Frigoriglobus tundricola TaxID=2774151 RepID=A0A6M5YIJ8_9BACT|nr:sigma 54-interacting transcriptional regulator [Frigoriglobus tundricola]QJW93364.1 sigma-54 dependent DNA-binding response regulator [Frigoriglobus tundricola]
MVSSRRLVLVAQDQRLAIAVQGHLQKAIQLTAPVVRFEDVPGLLTPETDGDLLFVAGDPTDAHQIEAVVRETKVQHLPAGLSVLETEAVRTSGRLDPLAPYLAHRFVWPHQPRELTAWAQHALSPGAPFAEPLTEAVAATIRRRLINHTPSLTAMVEQLCIAAAHDVTVLIEGETGTGKTYLAKLVHDCSVRRANRFLVVACGTLSGNLIASEFFGHVRGAFTSADAAKVGKFAAAGEGTILLDEIDTLGLEHQANLLRVIETGEFEPVGSNETQICKARIVAATNWNLADAVERGSFRRDLYYRLHVISFHLPPLRHRPEDIGPLVRGMVARYGTKYGKRLYGVCPEALRVLEAFPWPGNIRQLENVVQQAVLTSTGNELKVHHLSPQVLTRADAPAATLPMPGGFDGTLKQTREATERANILRALEKAGQSRTRAAQMLGVSRVTLYKKMKHYKLLQAKGPVAYPFDEFNSRVSGG